MGCKQCRVKPVVPVVKDDPKTSKSRVSQINIVPVMSSDLDKSNVYPIVVYRDPLSISKPLVVSSIISNESVDLTPYPRPAILMTPIKSDRLDDHSSITDDENLSGSIIQNPVYNSPPIISRDLPIFRENVSKSSTMVSNMSDIPEDSSINVVSDVSESQFSVYRGVSPLSTEPGKILYDEDRTNGFIFASRKRANTRIESTQNNIGSEANDISRHHSISSGASADSEGSIKDPPKRGKIHCFHLKKPPVQKNEPIDDETSSESDDTKLRRVTSDNTSCPSVKQMAGHLMNNLSITSAKLSNPDPNQNAILSETTSESDDYKHS